MTNITSAPMEHQVPNPPEVARCGQCAHFTHGMTENGLGFCGMAVVRTWTAADGFTAPMLPYPRQIACNKFEQQ